MRVWRVSGCIAMAVALATGCTSKPEIRFAHAEPAGRSITVPAGDVPASAWPDACTLLSDDEITAILPQATEVKREPQKITLWSMPRVEADGTVTPGVNMELPAGGCQYTLTLPSEYSLHGNGWLKVELPAISDEESITSYYEKEKQGAGGSPGYSEVGSAWGAQECYAHAAGGVADASCRQGRFFFEIRSGSTGVSDEVWRDKVISQVVRTLVEQMR